ncbi:TPA: alpha-amylase [bacterium]|nr:alpha-amylase [bacterium]
MAIDTKKELRQLLIYQVFVRNHTKEGTFKALEKDLARIKDLGADYIYLLPIHPIGEKSRKGSIGSPYSIKDYWEINEDLGTVDDFKSLINKAHETGLKVMMDIVFNHTSKDSRLLKERPEWFYKNEKGEFANRVGDWDDITDLDTTKDNGLYDELISIVLHYVKMGVDGFRCDVASLIPLKFWLKLRKKVHEINPNIIFLSESVHGDFLKHFRDLGYDVASECEIYQAFDIAYDYDTQPFFVGYLQGDNCFNLFLQMKRIQEYIYPTNYVKLRNLENHDFGRFLSYIDGNIEKSIIWHAEIFFEKGATMIYAGQEFSDMNKPNLFEKDEANFSGYDLTPLIKRMKEIKQDPIFAYGSYDVLKPNINEVFLLKYENKEKKLYGIFNVGLKEGDLEIKAVDGEFVNLIDGEKVVVKDGLFKLTNKPVIIEVKK